MPTKRVAINVGGGFVPGLNSVIAGAVLAARQLSWDVVGLRDGYDGLLFPERYPDGGRVKFGDSLAEDLSGTAGCVLGTAAHSDPFHVRTLSANGQVEERDRSDELLALLKKEKIDAVISIVGSGALSILFKLSRKGLQTVAVPKSAENDVAATALSFGFNTALSFTAEMLERARQAAQSARRVAVVEVPGEHAGWLALQAGIAVCADAILIPEIPYDLREVAAKLRDKAKAGRPYGLIVAAEGAVASTASGSPPKISDPEMKAALSPGATGSEGPHVIEGSGQVSAEIALEIRRLAGAETYPLVLGQLAKAGTPTVVDRQLGLGYGAGSIRALNGGQSGVMVIFQPPDLKFVPLSDAINRFRTVPADGEFIQIARGLGISLGEPR